MKIRSLSDSRVFTVDEKCDLVRAGGEGCVFALRDNSGVVVKIYHDPANRRAKLEAMLRNPPTDDATPGHSSIAWPVDLVEDGNGSRRFLGFLMPKVDRANSFSEFSSPKLRAKRHPKFTHRDLHVVASNAAAAFLALHQKGYVVGDVNEGNLLIRDDALATVVDTDSFQVRKSDGTTFRCTVGRDEYTPPELQGVRLADVDRKVEHDLFGLAVLLFQLLMEGYHPYSGVPSFTGEAWTLGRRISDGNFPWNGSSKPFAIPPLAPPLETLDPRLQKLFIDAFNNRRGGPDRGGAAAPIARPNASRWKRELDGAITRLAQCPSDPQHWYGSHLSDCPWCEREELLATVLQAAAQRKVAVASRSSGSGRLVPVPALPQWRTVAPAPVPYVDPAKYAEIQAGVWKLHPNQQMLQMVGGLMATSDQIYDLRANGSCTVSGALAVMGMSTEFVARGFWSYDYNNKVLAINGMMELKSLNFADPFMNMFGGAAAIPPQPLNARMTVLSGGGRQYTIRDENTGIAYLFERT